MADLLIVAQRFHGRGIPLVKRTMMETGIMQAKSQPARTGEEFDG